MRPVKIVLVDDQSDFRAGLSAALSVEPALRVVGEASDGAEALRVVRSCDPDVVLMDLRMPVLDGVQATERLSREAPRVRVVALTTFDDDALLFAALRAGACGYLLKDVSTTTLVETVCSVARGDGGLAPAVTGRVLSEFRRLSAMAPPVVALAHPLSAREVEVTRMLAEGATNKDIARALSVAEGTVKNHVTRVLEKLGVEDRTQAALRARALGLVL
jgi:DNA-binding NarL/FixJ family response regulator